MLTVSSRSHPGSVRKINEDVALWDPDLGLLAVADGMGGHNAGEVASRLAVDTLRAFLKQTAASDDITWPFGIDPALSFAGNRLRTAVKMANARVHGAAQEDEDYTGMGTTIVAALVTGAQVAYAGVGDSRIYAWRGEELLQLTADDSWICMLQKESGLGPGAFEKHPMRHVLTSVVGARPEVEVKVQELSLVEGQTLLLCSDGLHGALPDRLIASALKAEPDLERAARTLVEAAVTRDGSDNVTILLARHSG
jgi:serine/threonine protein phosphatase PrpC